MFLNKKNAGLNKSAILADRKHFYIKKALSLLMMRFTRVKKKGICAGLGFNS